MTTSTTPKANDDDTPGTIASGASIALIGRALGRALSMASHVFIARFLRRPDLGRFGLAWAGVRLFTFIVTLGLDKGCVRFAAQTRLQDEDASSRVIRSTLRAIALSAIVASTLLILFAPPISISISSDHQMGHLLRVLAPAVGLAAMLRVLAATTTIRLKITSAIFLEELLQPGLFFLGILLVRTLNSSGSSLIAYAWAYVVSLAIAVMAGLLIVSLQTPSLLLGPAMQEKRSLFRFSVTVQTAGLFAFGMTFIDRFWIAAYRTMAEIGSYQAVGQLGHALGNVAVAIGMILGPAIARYHTDDHSVPLAKAYQQARRIGLYISTPLILVVLFAGKALVALTLGERFVDTTNVLRIIAGGHFLAIAAGGAGYLLVMIGRPHLLLLVSFASMTLQGGLMTFLAPHFGSEGVALATASSIAALFWISLGLASHLTAIRVVQRNLLPWLFGASVGAAVTALSYPLVASSAALGRFVLTSLVSFAGFFLVLAFTAPQEDRRAMKHLFRRDDPS
ncbi:MAG: polysaccharide biosynthesis protein [Deltaproteobacteria bacterium]|nr:polysaccharide biosynthesis protein [Deltaproteobacteria bacterium]